MAPIQNLRPAAVAGLFYPGEAEALLHDLRALLDTAHTNPLPGPLKAMIVPHAGYIYSGPVAASAYALLQPLRDRIRRVVLLGPVHRVPVRGLALPGALEFETPLGRIAIDQPAVSQILPLRQVTTSAAAHAQEHSIEVQLPFLQQILGEFTLVPLAVGDATAEEVAEVLATLWGGPETLIVVSSDLSHYLPYAQAQARDSLSCDTILQLQHSLTHDQACGGTPINGLLLAARRYRLTPHLLDRRNSGDTAGDRERVVGYAAFAFSAGPEHVH